MADRVAETCTTCSFRPPLARRYPRRPNLEGSLTVLKRRVLRDSDSGRWEKSSVGWDARHVRALASKDTTDVGIRSG